MQRAVLPYSRAKQIELRLGIISWNIAGKDLTKEDTFIQRITRDLALSNLDLIVFGFQEIVELKLTLMNINKMMFKCDSISEDIKKTLQKALGEEFVCLGYINMMGLLQIIFLRRDRVPEIDWYYHKNWKIKMGGSKAIKIGNKGVVASIFQLGDFGKFSFTNCHMVHGFKNLEKRIQNFTEATNKLQSIS